MPRYFFDTHDVQHDIDSQGVDLADIDAACARAVDYLPPVACWAITKNGDNQALSVVVRDEANTVVYTATLTFAGVRFDGGVTKAVS